MWGWGFLGITFYFDGSNWTKALTRAGDMNTTLVGGDFWTVHDEASAIGRYCPDWCHPGVAPFHEALLQDWRLEVVTQQDPAIVKTVSIPVPPDVPRDGSVAYEGRALVTFHNHATIVGCLTAPSGTNTPPHAVLHEWDGSQLGPGRSLPPEVDCPHFDQHDLPLLDGTLVFRHNNGAPNTSLVLVSP
jgi:hypothetical protein